MNKKKMVRLLLSLVISIIAFVALVILQKNIVSPNGETDVVIAISDIDKGTIITEENKAKFFKVKKNVDGEFKTEGLIINENDLINKRVMTKIEKGSIISNLQLLDKDNVIGEIKEPVEASINVDNLSQAVAGTLREGDLIDISVVNEVDKKSERKLEGIYVQSAFSSDGKIINKSDTSIAATTINLLLEREDEQILNEALSQGLLRISRRN